LHLNGKYPAMKPSSFTIRIPEPCHEDWNAMQPDARGKFCGSCSKSVFDFSTKTDAEIGEILMHYKDQKICGHFKASQVNRPLSLRVDLGKLPRNLSATKAFAIAVFLVFGSLLFSCTNHHDQLIGAIEINPEQHRNTPERLMGEPAVSAHETITGDTIVQTCTTTLVEEEQYINGGMRIEEVMLKGEIAVSEPDTAKDQVIDEPLIMGKMEYLPDVVDTSSNSQVDTSARIRNHSNIPEIMMVENSLLVYPNPNRGEFTLQYELANPSDVRVDLFDLGGSFIKTLVNVRGQHRGHYKIPINVGELPNGVYLVNLISAGQRWSEKLVIER
jgi:hypothetical protein